MIAPSLTPQQRRAYYEAENAAVDRINQGFDRYAHYIVEPTGGALEPEALWRVFFRYKHVDYYEPELFGRTYEWMKSWNLTPGRSAHAARLLTEATPATPLTHGYSTDARLKLCWSARPDMPAPR